MTSVEHKNEGVERKGSLPAASALDGEGPRTAPPAAADGEGRLLGVAAEAAALGRPTGGAGEADEAAGLTGLLASTTNI